MTLLPVFEWLQSTALGETIRTSKTLVATVEISHLLSLTLFLGTLLTVDVALMRGGRNASGPRIAKALSGWTTVGLIALLTTGFLMLTSEAMKCYESRTFWVKMAILTAALTFHFTIHRNRATAERPARAVGITSLALWFGVGVAAKVLGIFG